MKVSWYSKMKRTSDHVDQKEIQTVNDHQGCSTGGGTRKMIDPGLAAIDHTVIPHVWFDSRHRQAQRPVQVWAAPCSLAFCLATTRSRTLADRAWGHCHPSRHQLSNTPPPWRSCIRERGMFMPVCWEIIKAASPIL